LGHLKIIGFVVIAFLAGTITSGAIAYADKDSSNPFSAIVTAIKNLTDVIKNKQTTVTVNAPQGPPGPPGTSVTVTPEPSGSNCANGGVKLVSASGINYVCNGGSSQTCSTGQVLCSGVCSSISTDTHNCGACGHTCATGQACVSGQCTGSSTQCTVASDCPTSNSCQLPTCTAGVCGVVNAAAGTACSVNGGTHCDGSGSCVSSCPAGQTMCGSTCINTSTDTQNCGACGLACNAANGVSACTAGTCSISTCNAGFANCDQNAANGCEVNTQTDPNNCGLCGNVCSGLCVAGHCAVVHCPAGQKTCDGVSCQPISLPCL